MSDRTSGSSFAAPLRATSLMELGAANEEGQLFRLEDAIVER